MRIAKSSKSVDLTLLDESAVEEARDLVEEYDDDHLKEIKVLRGAIVSEFNAISEYESQILSTKDVKVLNTLLDIKHEEIVHVGQLMACLFQKDPEMKEYFFKGLNEGEVNG